MNAKGSRAPRATEIAPASPPRTEPNSADASSSTGSQAPLTAEIGRELAAIFNVLSQGAQAKPSPSASPRPKASTLDTSAELLRELQLGLLRYPAATQAVFRALVSEGRSFAASSTGAELEQRLLASPDFRRLRRVYESLTWHMLEERGANPLPSSYFDALAQVTGLDHLEPFLAALHSVTKR